MKREYSGKILLIGFVLLITPVLLMGQDEGDYIRKGNRLYNKGEFSGSEAMYRRAQNQEASTPNAGFNLGDALYKQGRFSEAAGEFDRASADYEDTARQAESFYNLGNAFLKDNKYKESIVAYINSLKNKPDNMEAKYNLAYAQDQLKKQQEQEQQQQQQQQDKGKDQNKDKPGENLDKKNDKQDKQQDQKNPDQQQGTMSRDDAKRLLEALSAAEKKTQEKVRKEKSQSAKVRVIKNW